LVGCYNTQKAPLATLSVTRQKRKMIIFAPAFRIKEKKKDLLCLFLGGVGGCFSIWMAFFIHSFTTSSERKRAL
jgi:hypothetical protein